MGFLSFFYAIAGLAGDLLSVFEVSKRQRGKASKHQRDGGAKRRRGGHRRQAGRRQERASVVCSAFFRTYFLPLYFFPFETR